MHRFTSRRPVPRHCALFLLLALAGPLPDAAAAPPAVPSATLVAAESTWKSRVGNTVDWAMSSRRRMVQVSTIGMCIALYIIWWRK